jgi:hypothetical protein
MTAEALLPALKKEARYLLKMDLACNTIRENRSLNPKCFTRKRQAQVHDFIY